MTTEDGRKDFFISYTGADQAWATWIAEQLEAAGYACVIQAWDFRAAGNFVNDIDQALRDVHTVISVLSPAYLQSKFCRLEWTAALKMDPEHPSGKLLPVRIEGFEPGGIFGPIQYIDLVGLDASAARDFLLERVKRERAKTGAPTAFPGTAAAKPAVGQRFPGSLPPVWNIPHRRNPNFTGREDLLTNLRNALTSGTPAALTQAVHGLGGVGKTQLALEYAYRHKADYDIVWWVHSEDPSTLASDYAALAGRLGIEIDDPSNQPAIVEMVKDRLGHIPGWLLIFDNVPTPDDVKPYLPLGETGHVIITSRESDWSGTASEVTVKVWPREESVKFLLTRTGRDEPEDADKLAEALGDFPLALEQAGAYIRKARKSLAEYTMLYEKHRQDLLERGKPATDYEATVATTWEISFKALEKESPAAADLVNLCAFFAPDDIPLDMIRSGVEFLPEPLAGAVRDELKLDEALIALGHYSLVERGDGELSVHRLVQAVTHDRLDEDEQKKWIEAVVEMIGGAFPADSEDVRRWDECAYLLAHALASTMHAEQLDMAPGMTAYLLCQVGAYLKGRMLLADAKAAYERALRITRTAFGDTDSGVGACLNNLGLVLLDLEDPEGAKSAFEEAHVVAQSTHGDTDPVIATCLNNIGLAMHSLGDLTGAKNHHSRALAIDEAKLHPSHPAIARDLNNLASVLAELGDLSGAKVYFERAVGIDSEAYGPDHREVAVDLTNLAGLLLRLGKPHDAQGNAERALDILVHWLPMDHPEVVSAQAVLDIILQEIKARESR